MEPYALEAIQQLGYDFAQFSLRQFVGHVSALTGREMMLASRSFSDGLHGLWISGLTRDYVFFNHDTHRVHRIHIVLHELGHIILGHRGLKLPAFANALLPDSVGNVTPAYGRMNSSWFVPYDEDERAAEWFARSVQVELMQIARRAVLAGPPSSLEGVARFADTLGYRD